MLQNNAQTHRALLVYAGHSLQLLHFNQARQATMDYTLSCLLLALLVQLPLNI
jgi:hypothetical protein